jgi:4-amino-4-deoxy-L-arabinose transferase-like glycosyltransferase
MLVSWSNYFFVSFDPGGFLSVDKPPMAFWIQAACAKLLGLKGLSLLLPQALEGVAAVALVYYLVRRRFGEGAGLLASLVLALTPISVAVDRSNNPDSCLVLALLLATWALSLAAERGGLGPLLLCAAFVGLGFNTKMLVAYGVLPTFVLAYLSGAGLPLRKGVWHFMAAFAVLALVSVSWGLLVEMTPAERRPYIGSTRDNSVLGLTFGHNGLERVFGLGGERGESSVAKFIPGDGRIGMPGFGGPPGPLRLAGTELAGQIAWLVPIVLVGSIASACEVGLRYPLDPRHIQFVIWSGWLATYGIVFSFARGIVHPYYLVLLAPPVAALAGIGASALWRASRRGVWGTVALCTALFLTAAWESRILADHPLWMARLVPILVSGACLAAAGLIAAQIFKTRLAAIAIARASLAFGLFAVLVCPTTWALFPVLAEGNPMIPVADPALLTGVGGLAPVPIESADIRPLVDYLLTHRTGERYLLATPNLMVAALIIIETGEPVIATGGFLGIDPVLTPPRCAELLATRQLRHALVSSVPASLRSTSAGVADPGGSARWRIVNPALWRPEARGSSPTSILRTSERTPVRSGLIALRMGQESAVRLFLRRMDLYDCRPEPASGNPQGNGSGKG